MRFLMKTIVIRPPPRLIHAFRQNLSGCAWALAAVFVSLAKPRSRHPRLLAAAQLQLSIFWRQFNPAFQSCWHGNVRIQNPSRRRLCPIAHATFPRR
jgi:hypothetical protein